MTSSDEIEPLGVLPPGVRWLPLLACMVLALTGHLTDWWGMLVVAAVLVFAFTGYLSAEIGLTLSFFFVQPLRRR